MTGPTPRLSAREIAQALGRPEPTPEQTAVIEAPLRPHVVIAGAGSGKTETMAARVVWLVANGLVQPEEVLGLTFTRKAAGELADRISRRLRGLRASGLLPGGSALPCTVATYNAYAASLVRDHGLRVGIEPGARLLGEAATWQLVHDIVSHWVPPATGPTDGRSEAVARGEDLRAIDRALDTIVQAVISLAGQCAEHLTDPDDLATFAQDVETRLESVPLPASAPATTALHSIRGRRVLVEVLKQYHRRKRALSAMDFGDQIAVAADLAALPDVAAGERARFGVVLLDEFQDTSHAQLELLARLFGDGHPVTAVGDPNQSIYGWRGASAGNLTTFTTRFAGAGGPPGVLNLTTSWRNCGSVLAVANALSAPLRAGSRVPVEPLTTAPGAGPGRVEVTWHETDEAEAAWLAGQIGERWARPQRPSVAVLCRQRSQFPAVAAALQAHGLPVEVVGLGGLLQRPEVADLVATLQVLEDPTRSDALARLLTGPRWLIGPRDLAALNAWATELASAGPTEGEPEAEAGHGRTPRAEPSLIQALDVLPEPGHVARGLALSAAAHARLTRLGGELRRLRALSGLSLVDLVVEVERTLLLEVELNVARPGGTARAQLDAFLDVAAEFTDGTATPTLAAFLAWLAAAADRERGLAPGQNEDEPEQPRDGAAEAATAGRDVVQVLTVHAAKGLEWDVVAVPGMLEERFPAVRAKDGHDTAAGWSNALGELPYELRGDRDSLPAWRWREGTDAKAVDAELQDFRRRCGEHEAAEERRLAYVAVTRARHEALLSGYSWERELKSAKRPSRFLAEAAALAGPQHGVHAPDLAELPAPAPENPLLADPLSAPWPAPDPVPPLLAAAAEAVRRATPADLAPARPGASESSGPPAPSDPPDSPGHPADLPDPLDLLADDARRLLTERERRHRPVEIALPVHVSASRAVQLARDPEQLAVTLRRPVPVEPQAAVRRGTAFHDWVERRLHSQALVDLADLPGAGDDEQTHDPELERFQLAFERSPWSAREVVATEIDIETAVAGIVLRGRIDAVFEVPRPAAPVRYDVVDWKTGRQPRGRAARDAAVQLAIYRVAWARLRGVPLEAVRASFFYLDTGSTVTVADAGIAEIEQAVRSALGGTA